MAVGTGLSGGNRLVVLAWMYQHLHESSGAHRSSLLDSQAWFPAVGTDQRVLGCANQARRCSYVTGRGRAFNPLCSAPQQASVADE